MLEKSQAIKCSANCCKKSFYFISGILIILFQAKKYYLKGCDLGYADACLNSGLMCVSKGNSINVKKDYTKVSLEICSLKSFNTNKTLKSKWHLSGYRIFEYIPVRLKC